MFRKLTSAAAILLFAAACGSSNNSNEPAGVGSQQETANAKAAATASLPTYGAETALPVGSVPQAVLHDAQRNKDVAMTVEYPTRGGPYPVIIFSHTWGGEKESYTPLTEYWTSRGYICIKPAHADAGALRELAMKRREERRAQAEKDRAEGKTPQQPRRNRNDRAQQAADAAKQASEPDPMAEALWATQTPADWENRARDLAFIIDSLDALEQKYPELAGRMQKTSIGVGGHGYGAFTASLVAGMTSTQISGKVSHPRVKALLTMAAPGTGQLGLTPDSWRNITIPAMFIAGSLDVGPGGNAKWRRDPFANTSAGDKYYVNFVGGRFMTFTGGVGDVTEDDVASRVPVYAPQTDVYGNPIYGGSQQQYVRGQSRGETQFLRDRRVFNNAKVVATAFWDAYLKNDTAAKDYLKAGGTLDKSYSDGSIVKIERK